MVFGVGTDIVQISRIEMTWQRFGERFANRLLLDEERELFDTSKHPVRFLSMRFAVKEAVVKAMGTGFAHGMWVRDVGMVPNNWGQPQIIYSARGRRMCERLGIGRGHVSVTDEAGLIVAFAVLMNADSLGN
ncbi:MAG: holo-ACP synthase [Gammaproteobacteria bacterium]|nr:MAG: holo-ACP synthase [Gammaproteobacteria bacterium]